MREPLTEPWQPGLPDGSGEAEPLLAAFLAAGTEDSFAPLCRQLSPRMMRYFRMRGCDTALAEELTQDVLLTVFRHAGEVRNHSLFHGWLYRVARNLLLQQWRRARRGIDTIGLDTLGPNAREMTVQPDVPGRVFKDLIAALSPGEKEAVTLRFVEGLEYREIAAALDIPVGTVKWRVFSGKMKLALQPGAGEGK